MIAGMSSLAYSEQVFGTLGDSEKSEPGDSFNKYSTEQRLPARKLDF